LELGARILDFFVVFYDCLTEKARNLGINPSAPRLSTEKWLYYRFLRENPSSLSWPATRTECVARLVDFFVVFNHFATRKARSLGINPSVPKVTTAVFQWKISVL
jgi:hypothetical protein